MAQKRVVKNVSKRPVSLSDLSTNGVDILPGNKVDLLKFSTINKIAKSDAIVASIDANILIVYDKDNKVISSKQAAKDYIQLGTSPSSGSGSTGTTGPAGPAGPQGVQGIQGIPGPFEPYYDGDFFVDGRLESPLMTTAELEVGKISGIPDSAHGCEILVDCNLDLTNNDIKDAGSVTVNNLEILDTVDSDLDLDNNSILNANIIDSVVTKTNDYFVDDNDNIIFADAASGDIIITLPSASGRDGKNYNIKKIDSSVNEVEIVVDGSETIDGETSQIITDQYVSMSVKSNGSNWSIF